MAQHVTKTTDEDDVIWRFLRAAEQRVAGDPGRIPINSGDARAALSWLKGLVGRLKDDGSISP